MFMEERYSQICEFLKNKRSASVHQIAKEFKISLPTVRRDLSQLERQGVITRTHGGAISKDDVFIEMSLQKRTQKFVKEKKKIAQYIVSKLIQTGDTIVLDAGTTTYGIASLIRQYHLGGIKVITNSLENAIELASCQGVVHILTGGKLKPDVLTLVGPEAVKSLSNFHVDKVFLGISGLHWEKGLTDIDPEEAFIKKEFIKIAKEKIIVTDHSKIGEVFFSNVCPLSEIDTVITDSGLSNKLINKFKHAKINFICV